MTKFKTFLLLVISFVGFTTNAFAGEHPEANFGIYGIQHQSTVAGYQASIISTIVDLISLSIPSKWLISFNNFYYCRWQQPSYSSN